ncbi:MAG: SMC-Scp complex subunit ScpB [Gammaproteobacteria bacterium]|nr:SMC-Scp complex subunit ScpB [Gammaproteobacteria bacterium]
MDQTLINRIVEAALLAASQPLSVGQLRGLFTLDDPAPEDGIEKALEALQADCEGRGIELVQVASGWRYQVKSEVHQWVTRLWTERQTRYTRATLETLALIAYRQPITRGEIEQVRGVAVNSNIIKALEEREWIRVVGHRDVPGRPELLGTTKAFLDYFGLKRLDELPPLSELKEFGDLEPQLDLGDEAGTDPAEPPGGGEQPDHPQAVGDIPLDAGNEASGSGNQQDQHQTPQDNEPALAVDGDSDRSNQ